MNGVFAEEEGFVEPTDRPSVSEECSFDLAPRPRKEGGVSRWADAEVSFADMLADG
jgi:hypothetical protein